jgi:hypothetical protein
MALKKLRFVWSTPPLPDGRWRLGLFNLRVLRDTEGFALPPGATPAYWKNYLHHALYLSLRGLLAWFIGVALVAWFAGAAVLHQRLERANPRNRVGYTDLVLPTRWGGLDRLRGEGFVAQGRDLLDAGEFASGFGLLRLGLEKNPTDHTARLDVAKLYAALRLRSQAEKLLRDGLAHGYPGRDYLEFAFSLAADGDRPDEWVALVRLARERFDAPLEGTRPPGEILWLDQEAVRSLRAAGLAAEALAHVEKRYPREHPFRREVTVLHLLETGRATEAAALAEAWAADAPRAPEPLRLLVRARRESVDFAGMETTLARLRALDPAKPDAILYAVVQQHLAGRAGPARAALDELLFRHGATADIYSAAAAALMELRDAAALDYLEAELRGRGLSPRPVLWARLQLAVALRDWPSVLARADALRADRGAPLSDAQQAWLETAARLARACLDGASGTQASLVEIVTDRPGTLRLYRIILEGLLAADRPATARQILTLAEGPYQNARSVAALRARIEAALAAAAPGPARPDTPAELASAEALAAAFARRIGEKDTPGALSLLAAARRSRPAWFAAAEPAFDALELPVRARGDDPLRLQLLARSALARDAAAPDRLLALAREIHAEGPTLRAHALLLLKEILRHSPGHAEALGQLVAWEPRPGLPPLDAPAP